MERFHNFLWFYFWLFKVQKNTIEEKEITKSD